MICVHRFIAALLATLLLAACGGQPAAEYAAPAETTEEANAATSVPAPETTDEIAEDGEAAASAEGFPITVTDAARNELTLESAPEMVFCMWNKCASDMAFVGVMPDIINEGLLELGSHPAYFGEAFNELPTHSYAGESARYGSALGIGA